MCLASAKVKGCAQILIDFFFSWSIPTCQVACLLAAKFLGPDNVEISLKLKIIRIMGILNSKLGYLRCPVGISLELGFGQGPGGSTLTSHAALMGLRFQRKGGNPVLFRRYLPGMVTLDKVNRIRRNIMENLVSPAETNPDGQEILLWEDEESQQDFDDLITLVNDAESIESLGGLYGAESFPVMWIRHRPNLRLVEDEKDEEDENLNDADFEDELDANADIQALQPIAVRDSVEQTVAYKTAEFSPQIQHQHECPDCGERFSDWKSCREHLILTGHLDVSTPDLELEAKKLTKPVRWRCLECFEGFMNKSQLEQHLAETGHLAWAASKRGRGGGNSISGSSSSSSSSGSSISGRW